MEENQWPGGSGPKGSEIILLVQEDEMVRDLAHMILEASGYIVLDARNETEALALCAGHQGPINLLLTDLMLAELDGPELALRALQLRPDLKVMFMSEHTDDVVLKEQVHNRATLVRKPFTPVGLAEKVREALDSNVSSAEQT